MKLAELKEKCNQLGIIPKPTRHRKNPDRLEVCVDDCIKAIQLFHLDQLKHSPDVMYDDNLDALIKIKSPMLALLIKKQPEDIQKEIWDDYNTNWRFEKKYDGIRCFISYNGNTMKFSIYGRALDNNTLLPKDYSNRFRFTKLKYPFVHGPTNNFLLDCEFIIDGYTHEVLEEILDDDYKDIESFNYKFVIFDKINISDGMIYNNIPLKTRRKQLMETHIALLSYKLPISIVESKLENMTKEDYYNFIINNNGEGVIAKNLNSIYDINGKRNGDWTKIKRLRYEGTLNLNADSYDLFVSDYIINDNIVSGLELSSYLVNDNNEFIYDRFNNQIPITLGILYDLLPETKKILTLYDDNGKPYINPRFLDMVVEVKSTGFDDSINQLKNLKFVCWRLDKNSRDCKYNKNKI